MTVNGNGVEHKPELLSKVLTPKGWPFEVRVRELTAGDIIDLYETPDGQARKGTEVQFEILLRAVVHPETGEQLFKTVPEVRGLPARMVPGLLELLSISSNYNLATFADNTGERPTLPPAG